MAVEVLNKCHEKDEEKAQSILLKKISEFGDLTTLQVAMSAEDQKFISQPCVQTLLTKIWYNKITSVTPKYKVN